MTSTEPVIIKTLLKCSHCEKMELFDAEAVLVFDSGNMLHIRGMDNMPPEFWDELPEQLSKIIKHERENHQPHV